MSLNLPDYAGNMGFKDQVLALKWVNRNIKQFGGGANITVLGHGAGKLIKKKKKQINCAPATFAT